MILRARIVLPVSQPPIEDGAVAIDGHRIVWVGRWPELAAAERREVIDLGEVALLPGLINAHCHLDYTDMAGQIASPKLFSDWIKAIVAIKAGWSYTDFALSWLHGAQMLLRTGTTTVLDVEAAPELIPEMWHATPLRVVSFREMISLKSPPAAAEMVETAVKEWSALAGGAGFPPAIPASEALVRVTTDSRAAAPIGWVGLSPHAPYSTTCEMLRLTARVARERRWPLTTHVAESEEEFNMFMQGRGPLYDWLQSQRDMSDCGHGSPVQHLERCGYLSQNLLAVHANYLLPEDIALLARHRVSVVHCPGSHAYFGHRPFAYAELAAAGINLCLGTDSLASTLRIRKQPAELNLFAEMQALLAQRSELAPSTILRMATMGGAAALGQSGRLGELSPNALADLIVLPFTGRLAEVEEAVVHSAGEVSGCMINGHWVFGVGD